MILLSNVMRRVQNSNVIRIDWISYEVEVCLVEHYNLSTIEFKPGKH